MVSLLSACASMATLLVAVRTLRQTKLLHVIVNSRLSQLLAANKEASFAEGRESERSNREDNS